MPIIIIIELNNCPIVKKYNKYPKCPSGSLKISEIILKVEYKNKKYTETIPLLKIKFFLIAKKFNIKNKINPSNIASYI